MEYRNVKMLVDQIHNAPDAMGMGVVRIIFSDGESHVAQTVLIEFRATELIYYEVHMEVTETPLRVAYETIKGITDYTQEQPHKNVRVRVVFNDGEGHWTFQDSVQLEDGYVSYCNWNSPIGHPPIRVPLRVIDRIEGLDKDHPAAKIVKIY